LKGQAVLEPPTDVAELLRSVKIDAALGRARLVVFHVPGARKIRLAIGGARRRRGKIRLAIGGSRDSSGGIAPLRRQRRRDRDHRNENVLRHTGSARPPSGRFLPGVRFPAPLILP